MIVRLERSWVPSWSQDRGPCLNSRAADVSSDFLFRYVNYRITYLCQLPHAKATLPFMLCHDSGASRELYNPDLNLSKGDTSSSLSFSFIIALGGCVPHSAAEGSGPIKDG